MTLMQRVTAAAPTSGKSFPVATKRTRTLPRSFYRRDPRLVAPELIGKVLVSADGRAGRIVEVEAYCGAIDPAAHSFNGKTARNATMFGPAGHLYVYFTYGMHWCANTVCGEVDEGVGVLIRALEPLAGLERMRAARPRARRDRDLCSGPARLTQALGITGAHDGVDLVGARGGFGILDDGRAAFTSIRSGPRIGITRGIASPWRWYAEDSEHVSKR